MVGHAERMKNQVPRPAKAEGVDELARRAREFLEIVVKGVQA
jgi:hypothetical protein